MFRHILFAYDPDEIGGGGATPWAADLESRFEDETTRTAVDAYLRETWQPRMTKLETDFAETEAARRLFEDLNGEQAADTFMAVTEAMFGEEHAQKVLAALSPETPEETPVVTPETPAPAAETPAPLNLDALPPEVRAVVEAHQAQERSAAWNTEVDRVKAEHFGENPDDFRADEFALSVVACEGDINKGLEHYNDRMATLFPAPVETPAETPPPAALGTQPGAGGGSADAPVTETYATLDDALDSLVKDMAAPAPPAIGTV